MKKLRTPGAITVRSNVVIDGSRWDLVPGELLHALRRSRDATRLQHQEHMYYEPCSICGRRIAEINLTGCTRCTHAPTPQRVLGAQQVHRERVAEARRQEAAENAKHAGAIVVRATGIAYTTADAMEIDTDHSSPTGSSPRREHDGVGQ